MLHRQPRRFEGLRCISEDGSPDDKQLVLRLADAPVELLHKEAKVLVDTKIHILLFGRCESIGGGVRREGGQLEKQQVGGVVRAELQVFLQCECHLNDEGVGGRCVQ